MARDAPRNHQPNAARSLGWRLRYGRLGIESPTEPDRGPFELAVEDATHDAVQYSSTMACLAL